MFGGSYRVAVPRRGVLICSALAAWGLAAAAGAGDPPKPQPERSPQAANTEKKPHHRDPLICREVTETGSHVPRQRCHTQDEWARIDQSTGFSNILNNPALANAPH
jgi:hypothetical protein